VPAVFVHGVPDTPRLWEALLGLLDRRDVVTLALPGFGCPRPAGFPATKEAYLEWLCGALDAIDGPIDLVAHDWGAMLTVRAMCVRPDLVRTWAAGPAPIHEDYVWHDVAQAWQTPGVGESIMEAMTPEVLATTLTADGVPAAAAEVAAGQVDATMRGCILDLYRSAVHVGQEWGPDLVRARPGGLLLWGERDTYAPPEVGAAMAARSRARLVTFATGHWWPVEAPEDVAAVLTDHWAGSD
jgi:pimeloyl-ACP methyl ester carboxylesterase